MPSILEREILEQPEIIRAFLKSEEGNACQIAKEIRGRYN